MEEDIELETKQKLIYSQEGDFMSMCIVVGRYPEL